MQECIVALLGRRDCIESLTNCLVQWRLKVNTQAVHKVTTVLLWPDLHTMLCAMPIFTGADLHFVTVYYWQCNRSISILINPLIGNCRSTDNPLVAPHQDTPEPELKNRTSLQILQCTTVQNFWFLTAKRAIYWYKMYHPHCVVLCIMIFTLWACVTCYVKIQS